VSGKRYDKVIETNREDLSASPCSEWIFSHSVQGRIGGNRRVPEASLNLAKHLEAAGGRGFLHTFTRKKEKSTGVRCLASGVTLRKVLFYLFIYLFILVLLGLEFGDIDST
jgi:hypothetical protein